MKNPLQSERNLKLWKALKAHEVISLFIGVTLFIGITLIIHYAFRFWANEYNFSPLTGFVSEVRLWLSIQAYHHTAFIVDLLGYSFEGRNNTIFFESGDWLAINSGCSGFKQLLQGLFLFLFYPGKLLHKTWFIPLAILLMHVANVIRLVGVLLTLYYYPEWWEFSHDYIFRFVFYFILFLLWIWWEEKYRLKESK